MSEEKKTYGLVAHFSELPVFFEAAAKVRDAGFRKWDTFTPLPVHGLDAQMGLGRSKVPCFTLLGGVSGFILGTLMTWYMNAFDYALIVGGMPYWSPVYPFPVMYELTILLAAFGTLFGMFAMNLLPRHNHPVFEYDEFIKSGDDTFFIVIERADAKFDHEKTKTFLSGLGAEKVNVIEA